MDDKYYFVCQYKGIKYFHGGKIISGIKDGIIDKILTIEGVSWDKREGFKVKKMEMPSTPFPMESKYKEYIISKRDYLEQSIRFVFEDM